MAQSSEVADFLQGDWSARGADEASAAPPAVAAHAQKNQSGSPDISAEPHTEEVVSLADMVTQTLRRPLFWIATLLLVVLMIAINASEASTEWNWLAIYAWVFYAMAEVQSRPEQFFSAGMGSGKEGDDSNDKKHFCMLSSSAFISWIFAKSVYNASVLGGAFGWVGGVGYASWYISFLSIATVVYQLRLRGYTSLPDYVTRVYGVSSCYVFLLAISYRLLNEIWSNSMVVASFFGTPQTSDWWIAAIVSTAIPMGYVMLGGLRSSIMSDVLQAFIAVLFLSVVLGYLGATTVVPIVNGTSAPSASVPFDAFYNPVPGRAMWSLEGGFDLVLVGLLQGLFSYPFMDPVLTDRAFLAKPKVMWYSFVFGGTVAALFIFFFAWIGIYGAMAGVGGKPADVANHISPTVFSLVNIVMITSSISTLDSTFSSIARAWGVQVVSLVQSSREAANASDATLAASTEPANGYERRHILYGRVAIVLLALCGTLPLLANLTVLSATTVSGTVVMGLGPPMIGGLMFGTRDEAGEQPSKPVAFHLSFWAGVIMGGLYQAKVAMPAMVIGSGKYAALFGLNFWGLIICCACYAGGLMIDTFMWTIPSRVRELEMRIADLEKSLVQNKQA